MGLRTYRPTPVLIPESVPVRRNLRRNRDDYDGKPLPESEIALYDSRTVLYDMWVADEPRRLIAIGPPSINLRESLYPVQVLCNGRPLPVRHTEHQQFCVWSIPLPDALRSVDAYEVNLQFQPFATNFSLRLPSTRGEAKKLTLMTLQRNNPIRWIIDWCLWHRRLYGVDQILLYDNDSTYAEQLDHALQAVSAEVDVVLVHWPFPYGPPTSDRNRYGQTGALNHCREFFGPSAGWTIRLDLDEYLVAADGERLVERLQQYDRDGTGAVLFGSWQVPPVANQPPVEDRSVRSYSFRETQFTDRAFKYAFNPASIAVNKNHIAFPENWMLDRFRFAPATYERLASLVYRSLTKRVGSGWLGRKVVLVPSDEMFFYHFRGLNTNWKHREQIGSQVEQFDPERHVRDERINELLMRAGLGE